MKSAVPTVAQLIETTDDQERTRVQSHLVEAAARDRPKLRNELITALETSPSIESPTTRGWLVNTLAMVMDDDSNAYDVLLRYLLSDTEPDMEVRYRALTGLWSGNSKIHSRTLERILDTENELQVSLLAMAIQATAMGLEKVTDLSAGLSAPNHQREMLQAFTVVPFPSYRKEVKDIIARTKDERLSIIAERALEKMDENIDPSRFTGFSPSGQDNEIFGTESSKTEVKQQSPTGVPIHDGIQFSDDGSTVYIGGISLPVRNLSTSSNKKNRIWFTRLDSETLGTVLDAPMGGHGRKKKSSRKKPARTAASEFVLLAAADANGDLYGFAQRADSEAGNYPDSLNLQAIRAFDPPIPGEELRRAVSEPDLFQQQEPSLISDEQWAIIRELIRFQNPKLDDALPASQVAQQASAAIDQITMPASLETGASFTVQMTVRNTGNATWLGKQKYRIDCSIQPADAVDTQSLKPDWAGYYKRDIPPGGILSLDSPTYNAPDTADKYTLTCLFYGDTKSTSFEPVTETEFFEVLEAHTNADTAPSPKAEPEVAPEKGRHKTHDDTVTNTEGHDTPASPIRAPSSIPVSAQTPSHPAPEVRREIIRIREQYQAPKIDDRLILKVTPGETELSFAGQQYYSRLELPQDELLALSQQPREYGETLFRAVINDTRSRRPKQSTQFGYRTAMDALQNAPESRLRFEIKLPPKLEYLNWERLLDPDPAQPPFSTNERLPFYRRVDNKPIDPTAPPLQVLVAIASPAALGEKGQGLLERLSALQVSEERQSFRLGLEPLQQAGLAKYRILGRDDGEPVTLQRLTDAVRQGTHLIHLLAHGIFVDDDYHIVMEREDRDRPLVLASELAQMLNGTGAPLRLAILTACESGASDPLPGTGAALGGILVRSGFPAVISMQKRLGLRTAQVFNQRFYFHLARSGQVEAALAATRFDLRQGKVDLGDGWSVPMLHLGARTGKLFYIDEDRASRLEDQTPQLLSDEELRRAERSGTDQLLKALQDNAQTKALSEQQLAAISRAARDTLGVAQEAGSTPLAAAQNIAALQRQMPKLVRLQARELQQAVTAATQLNLPEAVFDQMASAINTGKHLVLIGPPGTGKTRLAHAVCDYATEQQFAAGKIPTTASADWTTFDTVGGYVPTSTQRLEFRPGIFLRAISSGRWLVIDEINRAEIDKAVGELFTVLSGQQVNLPYRVAGNAVRILPFKHQDTNDWVPQQARPQEYDYVVHPNWRILATMNIYDKSSLFAMSFAFMRRFAFVDVGVPDNEDFERLRKRWIDRQHFKLRGGFANDDAFTAARDDLIQRFNTLLDQRLPIMRYRELGPAIAEDMIAYIGDRAAQQQQAPQLPELLAEAFLLYAVPQMDGLSREVVTALYCQLKGNSFAGLATGAKVLERIEALYPHIPADDWESAFEQWRQRNKPAAGADA